MTKRISASIATLLALVLTGALGACSSDAPSAKGPVDRTGSPVILHTKGDGYAGTLVKDPPLRPAAVTLTDTHGRPYQLARRPAGNVTVLYFGFTHCDDVCPTTMADLAAARRALTQVAAKRVDVVFVTVDPNRDRPRLLRSWLDRFDADITGLRAPMTVVHRAERSLYADQSAIDRSTTGHHREGHGTTSTTHDGYEVSHSGSVYVFGPANRTLLYSGGTTVDQYATDFRRLLRAG